MNTTTTPTTEGYSVLNAMVDIVAAPSRALDEIRQHPRWFWTPLLILLAVTVGVFVFYFSWVDSEWLVNEVVAQAVANGAPPDQAEQMRTFMSPTRQMTFTVVSIVLITFIIYAIEAVYFHLVNKIVGDPAIGYGQWFSFSAWTAFVGIVNALVVLVMILIADSNQVRADELMALSMNSLFIHAEPGGAWFNWGNSLTLVNFWTLWLMTLGFSRWTGSSMTKSAIVAVTPWVLFFGIWALLVAT